MVLGGSWYAQHGGALWWTVSGVLATLLISTGVFWLQRSPKRLGYRIKTNAGIFSSASRAVASKTVVLYGTTPLANPRLLEVRFTNRGKRPIDEDDYREPISIQIVSDAEIVESTIVAASNDELKGSQLILGGRRHVELRPRWLDRGDWLDVQLLLEGQEVKLAVTSRVKDQTERIRSDDEPRGPKWIHIVPTPIAVGLFAASECLTGSVLVYTLSYGPAVVFVLFFTSLSLFAAGILFYRSLWRYKVLSS